MNTNNVTRLEIIDWTNKQKYGGGRQLVIWEDDVSIEIDLQDEGRTIKVFVKDKDE